MQSGTAHCLQKNLVCTRLPACRSEQALHSGLNLGFSYLSGKWRSVRRSSGSSDGRPTFLQGGCQFFNSPSMTA